MKNLLITGGTGFLGGHLCHHLVSLGYHLYVLVRPTSDKTRLEPLASKINFFVEDQLNKIGSEITFDAIIHTATDYGRHGDKDKVFQVNYKLPSSLLKIAIEKKIRSFINIDSFSSLITGYPYLPHYHSSKRAFLANAITQLLLESTLSFNTLRLHHLYGTYDDDRKFIPFIIQSLLSQKENIDLTAGVQKRDFVFVTDVVNAIEKVLDKSAAGIHEFEVGTGECFSIRHFVEQSKVLAQNKTTTLSFGALETRANELMEAVANNQSLVDLGWKPQFPLEKGIQATIKYYRAKMS